MVTKAYGNAASERIYVAHQTPQGAFEVRDQKFTPDTVSYVRGNQAYAGAVLKLSALERNGLSPAQGVAVYDLSRFTRTAYADLNTTWSHADALRIDLYKAHDEPVPEFLKYQSSHTGDGNAIQGYHSLANTLTVMKADPYLRLTVPEKQQVDDMIKQVNRAGSLAEFAFAANYGKDYKVAAIPKVDLLSPN